MLAYIFKRLALMPLTLFGITFLVFVLTRFLPGGPLERRMAQESEASALPGINADASRLSPEQMAELKAYYGLDKGVLEAYAQWWGRLLSGDLGQSLRYQEPITKLVGERLPVSLMFGISSLLFSYGLCVPLGLSLAFWPQTLWSRGLSAVVILATSIPTYVFAMALFLYAAASKGWFPLGGLTCEDFSDFGWFAKLKDILHHATLPLLSYLASQAAALIFLMRSSLDEQLAAEYMRTARAKGASHRAAVWRHALPMSLIPLASKFGNNLALLLAGSFVIERIYNIDGIGLLAFEGLIERDYPMVLGLFTLFSLLHLLGNLLSDLSLAWIDPRIRWEAQ